MWTPTLLVVEANAGQILDARVLLLDNSEPPQEAVLYLGPVRPAGFQGTAGSLALAYDVAGFVSGVASGGSDACKLFFAGREQKNLKPYKRLLQKVEQLADEFSEQYSAD